ncbi:MAG: nicotinate phosphoribosyltransferase [Calditrichaeota bacterium]|nr:nicotinate phosphoribosyltransferase [Calditrichota bacterium]
MKANDRQTAEGILFTDQYQLTMGQVYFRMGLHEREAQFDHFFRNYPDYGMHKAGYCINAGLEWVLDWMEEAHFREKDIAYLRSQKNRTGTRVFDDDYLDWLKHHFSFEGIQMMAIPEGRVVHPHVPLTIVRGPLIVAQILETALLNQLNFQTLIATKAARIRESGHAQLMLEFGLRRAHERGANAGARAALIGGADFTSNVGISHVLGFAPKGTHAHSMIQAFLALGQGEVEAFRAYAEIYPDDCVLLVDTIDTLNSGVPNAITVFEELRRKGHEPVGVRLDSGDLAYLSIQVAKMLDAANFPDTVIVLSNNLDELVLWQIITQIEEEAPRYGVDAQRLLRRLVYGVGTRLITSNGASSLGGVYKLVALNDGGQWVPAIKISETPDKTPNPGDKRVWRIYDRRGKATADLISLEGETPEKMKEIILRNPLNYAKRRTLNAGEVSEVEPLLSEILRDGRRVAEFPDIPVLRERRQADVARLDPGIRRLMNPHIYHVSITQKLWDVKEQLIREMKGNNHAEGA